MDEKFALRDQAMAENVAWLLERAGPEAKVIIWAHNVHVQTAHTDQRAIRAETMGMHLRERFGSELVVFGFSFYQGTFNSWDWNSSQRRPGPGGLMAHEAPPLMWDAHETYLHCAGIPRFFLDLRDIPPDSPASDWLGSAHWLRTLDEIYDSQAPPTNNAQFLVLPEAFDVIIYFEETSPTALLPRWSQPTAERTPGPTPGPGVPLARGYNLDFERGLSGWDRTGTSSGHSTGVEKEGAYRGRSAWIKSFVDDPQGFTALMQTVSVHNCADCIGRKIRVSAHLRTQEVAGWAGLWLRVDGWGYEVLAFDTMQMREPIKGTTDWQQYNVVVDVPEGSISTTFGLILDGAGQVWADDFTLEVLD